MLRGIYGYGFVKPSPIQQKGILPILTGKDTVAQVSLFPIFINQIQAQSGTGKTATFTIATLQIINTEFD